MCIATVSAPAEAESLLTKLDRLEQTEEHSKNRMLELDKELEANEDEIQSIKKNLEEVNNNIVNTDLELAANRKEHEQLKSRLADQAINAYMAGRVEDSSYTFLGEEKDLGSLQVKAKYKDVARKNIVDLRNLAKDVEKRTEQKAKELKKQQKEVKSLEEKLSAEQESLQKAYAEQVKILISTETELKGIFQKTHFLSDADLANVGGFEGIAEHLRSEYDVLFIAAGHKYNIAPNLLAAVAKQESGFNVRAESPVGALGLMQIMPGTAVGLGVDPLEPRSAVDGAARMLAALINKFGSVELALAGYNAGPGAVEAFGGIPPYPETQNYVMRITSYLK